MVVSTFFGDVGSLLNKTGIAGETFRQQTVCLVQLRRQRRLSLFELFDISLTCDVLLKEIILLRLKLFHIGDKFSKSLFVLFRTAATIVLACLWMVMIQVSKVGSVRVKIGRTHALHSCI